MSLRDEAITHMADEFNRMMDSDWEGADWNNEEYAMHMLDALLDFLDAHTEEWFPVRGWPESLAALRGTTEGES